MAILRAITLFVILAFAGCVIVAGFMTTRATADKMDGKPVGGRGNLPDYSSTPSSKPPTKTKKPAKQQNGQAGSLHAPV